MFGGRLFSRKTANRRQHVRHGVQWDIPVRTLEWQALEVLAQDVSEGGIRLVLPVTVSAGDRLVFGPIGAADGLNKLTGEVRHVSHHADGTCTAGLRWQQAARPQFDFLRVLIEAESPEPIVPSFI